MKKYFKYIALLGILFILLFASIFVVWQYKSNRDDARLYKQGMEFYNNKKWQDAYYNFKQIKFLSSLYEVSLIKQYQCADKLADKKTAKLKLELLILKCRDKNVRPWAMYREAVLTQELDENNGDRKALSKFKKILKQYPDTNFGIASAYKIAILTDNKNFAKEKYIEYLKYAPLGKFALSAVSRLREYKDLDEAEYEVIADTLFLNSRFQEALELYKLADFKSCWFKISKCYRAKKQSELERDTILKAFNSGESTVDEKDIISAVDRLCALFGGSKKQNLKYLSSKYISSPYNAAIIYRLAQNSSVAEAAGLYEEILNKYPSSVWASNSLWEVFWYNYKLGRYSVCLNLAQTHAVNYAKTQDAPRIAYWQAKILSDEKRNAQAREIFKKIIKNYPLSYYSFLSARQLKNPKAENFITKAPVKSQDIKLVSKSLFDDNRILKYLAEANDFETIDEFKIQDDYVKSWILYKKGNYPASITLAQNKYLEDIQAGNINFQDRRLELLYPALREDEINEHCKKYNISPYLFLSLIREESHFDKYAKSPVGALGLSQIMKQTAEFIEGRPVSNQEIIKDNIKIGVKYFDYLVKFFKGNEYLAILAYNAGPGKINRWLEDDLIKNSEVDVFVENIPYIETKNYMKKILSSYWAYVNIYSEGF